MVFDSLHKRRDAALKVLVVVFQAVFVLILLNYFFGGLRFIDSKVNFLVFAIASALPVVACVVSLGILRWSRLGAQLWVSPLLCAFGLLALFCEFWQISDISGFIYTIHDRLQPEQTIVWNGTTISVWQDLTYEHGSRLVIQDVKIAGPLVWRRELARFYLAMEVTVTPVDAQRLSCKVREPDPNPPYDKPVDREVVLTVD